MSIATNIVCPTARVAEVSQSIGEISRLLADGGVKMAVVCDGLRYVGTVYAHELDSLVRQDRGLEQRGITELFPLRTQALPDNSSPLVIRRFIEQHDIPAIPFTDRQGRLTRLLTPEDALEVGLYENAAVTMAGGFGMRLRPITENTPKPMIPLVNGKLMDRILDHMLDCGIYKHYVAVHYLKEQVMEYLGDGSDRGLQVEYIIEDTPQGTAGSLRSIAHKVDKPLLVNNGDVITNQRFGEILRFHNSEGAQVTVVCKEAGVDISYGVVECNDDGTLQSISEKPRLSYLVNTGIYVVSPEVLELVPDRPCYMTDMIELVREKGGRVSVFKTKEYWRDIGTIDCYAQVIKDIHSGLVRSFDGINGSYTPSGNGAPRRRLSE
jgi:dTDP-glucose pyrophosphorylase